MIETSRLKIIPFSEAHAAEFFELTQDEGFNKFPINVYRQASVETTREWLRDRSRGKYGVWEKSSGKLIGMGGLTPWNCDGEDLVDITYRLRESAWGKGFGWELAEALVDHGFTDLNLEQITATIMPANEGSKKIALKLGMRFDKHITLLNVPTDLYRLYKIHYE